MAHEILSVAQMYAADRFAVASGVASTTLMENAGRAVAERVLADAPAGPVLVLAGPGANGGDGYVAARWLAARGRAVRVARIGPPPREGDAAWAASLWDGATIDFTPSVFAGAAVVVDAVFGAGLSRPLEGCAAQAATLADADGRYVVAVDVPSGVMGDGAPLQGAAFRAHQTVTFFRKKPAHLLEPSASLCGRVHVADIAIPAAAAADPLARENHPDLWLAAMPWPGRATHKHERGRLAVWLSGSARGPSRLIGAPRLVARAGARAGAGWVSLFGLDDDIAQLAGEPASLMLVTAADLRGVAEIAASHDAVVVGPGLGRGASAREITLECVRQCRRAVVDADSLSVFEGAPQDLMRRLTPQCVLTPHGGEFRKVFARSAQDGGDKIAQTRAAAAESGAVVLYKGPDTVIAAPDGRVVVNVHATPWLATAGAGDVLAGVIGGLLAQGAQAFDAACAGAWIQGEAGRRIGPGLIADDLPEVIGAVLAELAPTALRAVSWTPG